jgi:hypothetical protein
MFWNVYLMGKKIDTVFFTSDYDAPMVLYSLINYDNYASRIVVQHKQVKK